MWGITWLKERAHQVSYMTHQRGRLTDLLKHFIVSEVITEEKLEKLEKKNTQYQLPIKVKDASNAPS